MEYYLIVKTIKSNNSFMIAEFDLVSGNISRRTEIELVEGVYFGGLEYIELRVAQAKKYDDLITFNKNAIINNAIEENKKIALKKLDLNYIITGVATPEPELTLDELKEAKKTTLNTNLKVQVDNGYTYNTWNYPISENTFSNIIKQETMIKIAERKGVTIDSFQLTDGSNVDRTYTAEQYNDFAFGYALVTAKIEKWHASIRNAINNASNETILNAIDLAFPTE